MAELPFASAEGLKKVIEHVNRQSDRITTLALMNVELVKMLIASGNLDRDGYLVVLDELAKSQMQRESVDGANYTQLLKAMIEAQTREKTQ